MFAVSKTTCVRETGQIMCFMKRSGVSEPGTVQWRRTPRYTENRVNSEHIWDRPRLHTCSPGALSAEAVQMTEGNPGVNLLRCEAENKPVNIHPGVVFLAAYGSEILAFPKRKHNTIATPTRTQTNTDTPTSISGAVAARRVAGTPPGERGFFFSTPLISVSPSVFWCWDKGTSAPPETLKPLTHTLSLLSFSHTQTQHGLLVASTEDYRKITVGQRLDKPSALCLTGEVLRIHSDSFKAALTFLPSICQAFAVVQT